MPSQAIPNTMPCSPGHTINNAIPASPYHILCHACYGKGLKCLATMCTIVMSIVKEDDSFLRKVLLVINKGVDNDTPGHNI